MSQWGETASSRVFITHSSPIPPLLKSPISHSLLQGKECDVKKSPIADVCNGSQTLMEWNGLKGDLVEGTVQRGLGDAMGFGLHCHPKKRKYERAL